MEFFSAHFEKLLESFSERSRDILAERYGLYDGKAKTLDAIGRQYSITRERVRQILGASFRDVKTHHSEVLRIASDRIREVLGETSGIRSEKSLFEELECRAYREIAAARFFLECSPEIQLIKEADAIEKSYASERFSMKAWSEAMRELKELFEKVEVPLEKEALLLAWEKESTIRLEDAEALFDYITVSKTIAMNPFGKIGLVSWKEIAPKGTREKAELILSAIGEPLHFREIARLIDEYGLGKYPGKPTHPQTVHNELIKSDRFALAGRGAYALAEWGSEQRTVREVVTDILRSHGMPMKKKEIIEKVLALRGVRPATVAVTLSAFFAKVGEDAYTVEENS